LQCIPTHQIESKKLEALAGIGHRGTINMTQHIRFAAAGGAWTSAPQQFEFQKRFCAIVPGNGQFVSDLLNVAGLKAHQLS
jgi:hypothetical protein